MKKYKTLDHWGMIDVVEVDDRESEKFVWINGKRRSKRTDQESYFDTFDEAKQHLLKVAKHVVYLARRHLELAESHYGNIKGLKEEGVNK
jgi:hypothetical protein